MDTLNQKLQASSLILNKAGGNFTKHAERMLELADQLDKDRLNLAVLGQFKRGKSTLVNALLKAQFLPTAVLPLTAVPTEIFYGIGRSVRISFTDNSSQEQIFNDDMSMSLYLNSYVTEEENPCNIKNVKKVEIEYPSDFLAKGIVLIDTPGTGSTYKHNTDTTMEFIDQCDAALFVLSVDPPITENELALIKFIRERISKIFVILNKTDYYSEEEIDNVTNFLMKTLENSGCFQKSPVVYRISARTAVKASDEENSDAYEKSGLPLLEADLMSFFKSGKKEVLENAVKRKSLMVFKEAMLQAELNIKTLEMPLDELRNKRKDLEMRLTCLNSERESFFDLVNIDKKRVVSFCQNRMAALKKTAAEHFGNVLKKATGPENDLSEADRIIAEEMQTFFSGEFKNEVKAVDERVEEILNKYISQVNSHVDNIRFLAASIFDINCSHIDTNISTGKKRLPYWSGQVSENSLLSSGSGLIDLLLPAAVKRERNIKRLKENIATLIVNNIENMRWSLLQNIESLFREFVSDVSNKFNETIENVVSIVETAEKKREERAELVMEEIGSLKGFLAEITSSYSDIDNSN